MVLAANLGFPRIGPKRELKKAVEGFWKGDINEVELQKIAKELRGKAWQYQKEAGVDHIPSNDFSFYDQVLDTICLLGAVPERYNWKGGNVDLDTYFACARGKQASGVDVVAMEMTKWFDTNYHFIVPELKKDQKFALSSSKIFDEFDEAKEQGVVTRPVLLGPVTFLSLAKSHGEEFNKLDLLDQLLPVYEEILSKLESQGAEWVQIDEPVLALDIDADTKQALEKAFARLADASGLKILVASYFADTRDNLQVAFKLPVEAVHLDLVRAPAQLDKALASVPDNVILSLGVVDGRNVWKNNFERSLAQIKKAVDAVGADRVIVAPSCSLLHSPVCLSSEEALDEEVKQWLAFAAQKVAEIVTLKKAAEGDASVEAELADNKRCWDARETSTRIHNQDVKTRAKAVTDDMLNRKSDFKARQKVQKAELDLPLLPTTTIGSFPQTQEVRQARAKFKKDEIDRAAYDKFLEEETVKCIRFQEEVGIDVLVHGEFERNDMVEYFGEKLEGFIFTKFGWVQSYGSRCVKPPIIFGDVSRPEPMTVRWSSFAQENTKQYMKGMLTGPVTILQWSFVRDDQPRSETCKQIALAVRDEVCDLEKAGIKIIQIDEAALREGLPLRRDEWKDYLNWAVDSFRITASGVEDNTQIHTHMCYSEFNDIIEAVANMDADVISIETSRSAMELLDAFVEFNYPNEIGPGVYDIHSPRVPKQTEMETLLHKALEVLTPDQVWVNPDCGLKTRGWKEVEPAVRSMVDAAKHVREELDSGEIRAKAS